MFYLIKKVWKTISKTIYKWLFCYEEIKEEIKQDEHKQDCEIIKEPKVTKLDIICQGCYISPCQCRKEISDTKINKSNGRYSTASHCYDKRLRKEDKSDISYFIATPEDRDWFDDFKTKDVAYYLSLSKQLEKTGKK